MSWLLAGVLLVHQVTGATPHLPRSQKRWASGRWGVCPLGGCGCVPASCCTPSAEQRAWGSIQTGSMGASARRSPGHQRVSWSMRDAPHVDTAKAGSLTSSFVHSSVHLSVASAAVCGPLPRG